MMKAKVIVTAGGSGIGLEIARAFAASGAAVYACDIDAGALENAAAAIAGLRTGICDIGDADAVDAMVAEAARLLGGIDVLVNNAGIGGPTKPVHEITAREWDEVLRVNLSGAFNVTRNAIPHLIASGRGVIINMSSVAGRFGYPNRSPYAAAKWGLIGFTKTLSMELGEHNVRVNAIAPGSVDGERLQRILRARAEVAGTSLEEIERVLMSNQSLKHLVDPKDIAALAVFLASDAGKSISGQVIPIDADYQRL